MHELLIDRGRIIDRLIEIKARQGGGSAFRPAREASMMRNLAERHRGRLPLDTVESIWRVIISTFTYIQAPYSVHVDVSRGEAAIRDSARFHFGFTVPCVAHRGAADVIAEVAKIERGLGNVSGRRRAGGRRVVDEARPAQAPKVIARLPFVERPDHPAGLPVFVISKPLAEGAAREVVLDSITLDQWRPRLPKALHDVGAEILGSAADGVGLALLVARPGEMTSQAVRAALKSAGGADVRSVEIGAHASRFDASTLRARAI